MIPYSYINLNLKKTSLILPILRYGRRDQFLDLPSILFQENKINWSNEWHKLHIMNENTENFK